MQFCTVHLLSVLPAMVRAQISSVAGDMYRVVELQPNIGTSWYLFTEVGLLTTRRLLICLAD